MQDVNLTTIDESVRRLVCGGMSVDIVVTSEGLVRVGSMPDIAKILRYYGMVDSFVVIPDWQVSEAGDNRTGEEFVLWHGQKLGGDIKNYLGLPHNVRQVQQHLDAIFPFFFDKDRLRIVRKDWLRQWFQPSPIVERYSRGDLEIQCSSENIIISDGQQIIYNRLELLPEHSVEEEIEGLLSTIERDSTPRDCLEIVPVGCGNGFHGTAANVIVRYADYVLWIDPCGYPAHNLARHNVHWDDITHYIFTHNHEDHVQGLTACLQRARKLNRPLNLLAAESVFGVIQKLYRPLFPDLMKLVCLQPLHPGIPVDLGPIKIESRWNHHILPYGTLGLRISAGGRSFGFSGDTKYDEKINRILQKEDLTASWFEPCDLVFHEIDFGTPDGVHTHWEQVASLQRKIPGKILGYHTIWRENSPFELAVEGRRYLLE